VAHALVAMVSTINPSPMGGTSNLKPIPYKFSHINQMPNNYWWKYHNYDGINTI
jgi:hypothetical protein